MRLPAGLVARRRARRGLTLIEMSISIGLVGILFAGLTMVLGTTGAAVSNGSLAMDLEARGSRTMQRIVESIRAADNLSLGAVPGQPFSAPSVTFERNTGYDGTSNGWTSPYSISVVNGSITLTEDATLPTAREIPWCSGVTPLLEGELLNGVDDNGNGLLNEPGLCFERNGSLITIRFTLQETTDRGDVFTRTWMSRVYCRN